MKSIHMGATFNQTHGLSFAELYKEISEDIETKIAKFQARANVLCADDEW